MCNPLYDSVKILWAACIDVTLKSITIYLKFEIWNLIRSDLKIIWSVWNLIWSDPKSDLVDLIWSDLKSILVDPIRNPIWLTRNLIINNINTVYHSLESPSYYYIIGGVTSFHQQSFCRQFIPSTIILSTVTSLMYYTNDDDNIVSDYVWISQTFLDT